MGQLVDLWPNLCWFRFLWSLGKYLYHKPKQNYSSRQILQVSTLNQSDQCQHSDNGSQKDGWSHQMFLHGLAHARLGYCHIWVFQAYHLVLFKNSAIALNGFGSSYKAFESREKRLNRTAAEHNILVPSILSSFALSHPRLQLQDGAMNGVQVLLELLVICSVRALVVSQLLVISKIIINNSSHGDQESVAHD